MAVTPSSSQLREILWICGPAALLIIVAFWFAHQFVEPAPPKILKITTGGENGGYHTFGKRYAEVLKKSGIELVVKTSAGSVENIKRLSDPDSGFSVGLLQGGISNAKSAPELVSLGRVFLEPLWVFYKSNETVDRLAQLSGKRIAVGPNGSGTRELATALLEANQISAGSATLLPITGKSAVHALKAGDADAIFLVLSPQAPLIKELLKSQDMKLMNFTQAEAYTRLFPYLSKVTLPQGVIDLVKIVPSRDVNLLAASAALVARKDMHPALAGLLAQAALETHGGGGLFHQANEFPNPVDPEFPISGDAARIYKSGPPFLQRYLPFWLASFIDRMVIMALPVATVLLPLIKIVPWLYRWRVRKRILHWYAQLKSLERDISNDAKKVQTGFHKAEIERIDEAVSEIPIPLEFTDQFYDLRSAIALVRQRIIERHQPESEKIAAAE